MFIEIEIMIIHKNYAFSGISCVLIPICSQNSEPVLPISPFGHFGYDFYVEQKIK